MASNLAETQVESMTERSALPEYDLFNEHTTAIINNLYQAR